MGVRLSCVIDPTKRTQRPNKQRTLHTVQTDIKKGRGQRGSIQPAKHTHMHTHRYKFAALKLNTITHTHQPVPPLDRRHSQPHSALATKQLRRRHD